jgi:SAM-dependent methyltransferase
VATIHRPSVAATLRYDCAVEELPARLRECFVELGPDEQLHAFLARAQTLRHGRIATLAQRLLCELLSDFDANALLNTYPLYLLSRAQWETVLGGHQGGRLLDVGAGAGEVTAELAPLFAEVTTTETSRGMAWRLRRRGFKCWRIDLGSALAPDAPYDAVSCLNVLDRCDRPLSLLRRLRLALASNGKLILSLPLPYAPICYRGPSVGNPSERLPCDQQRWEQAVVCLALSVLEPAGLVVERLTRVPYLSVGDMRRNLYILDSALWVCRTGTATNRPTDAP